MNHFFRSITGLALSCLFISCQSELDIPQHGVTSPEAFYKTADEVQEGLTAIYSKWVNNFMSAFMVKNLLSDDVYSGSQAHTGFSWYPIADFSFTPDQEFISNAFSGYYSIVYAANMLISHVDESSSDPVILRCAAEARVLRALAYFNLVTLWGTPPLVDHPLSEDEYQLPNSSEEELWAFVEDDLLKAISSSSLLEKKTQGEKLYRVTKQFAQALLGKVYVFEKKYSQAAALFEDVIDSGKYALLDNYSNVYVPAGDGSAENLLEWNMIIDMNDLTSSLMTNAVWMFCGLRGEYFSFDASSPITGNTFGALQPTQELYDAFLEMEGEDGYRLRNTLFTLAQGQEYGIAWAEGATELEDCCGVFNYKLRILKEGAFSLGSVLVYGNNPRVMRYSEVLLLAAEANLQSGNSSKARQYLNMVRSRAHLSPLAEVDLDAIKKEKRLELCFEEVRFQDLLRWGDAPEVLAHKGERIPVFDGKSGKVSWKEFYPNGGCGFKTGKHERLPFPTAETSTNKNLIQNPGW